MSVHVVSAAQAAALDAAAIAAGTSSRQLMRAAGCAAAALAVERYPLEVARGVAIFAGSGNNGGDAWVVAGELARRGVRVRVAEAAAARRRTHWRSGKPRARCCNTRRRTVPKVFS